jgi:hypothetical protein
MYFGEVKNHPFHIGLNSNQSCSLFYPHSAGRFEFACVRCRNFQQTQFVMQRSRGGNVGSTKLTQSAIRADFIAALVAGFAEADMARESQGLPRPSGDQYLRAAYPRLRTAPSRDGVAHDVALSIVLALSAVLVFLSIWYMTG